MSNFGCCGGNKKKEKIIVADKDSLDVILATGNMGQRYIYGGVTRVKYGYFGQGDLILGVAKVDIRSRPSWFICPNCRHDFTVTKQEVFCSECSRVVELTQINVGKLVERVSAAKQPTPLPPPPTVPMPISKINLGSLVNVIAAAKDEADEWMEDYPSILIADINFGRRVNKAHKYILADKGIVSLYDVRKTGFEGLTAIMGIGNSVATALLEAAELEVS